jgi:hypothetical protein
VRSRMKGLEISTLVDERDEMGLPLEEGSMPILASIRGCIDRSPPWGKGQCSSQVFNHLERREGLKLAQPYEPRRWERIEC